MKTLGSLRTRKSNEIKKSKIGIGFECLDRKMWDDTDEVYRLVGELGVKHARVQTGWSLCEEEKGTYDFAWLDRIVDKLLEQGIQPWFNLGYGNIHHTDTEHPDAVGWAPIRSDESRAAWKAYVQAVVTHFRGKVDYYEIWNEPDINCFWVGDSNPDEYMDLLKMTVPVIREYNPECKIIGCAMARGLGWTGFAVLERYLQQGLANYIDIYSFHRYHVHPELNRPCDFQNLRETFKAYGGEHIELWEAESGCPSQSASTQALANTPVTKEVQAKVLTRSILTDLSAGLDYTCYFHMSDFRFYYRNGYCEVPNHFGLISFDNPPECKPSYFAFQRICTLFDDETKLAPRTSIEMSFDGYYESKDKYDFQTTIINSKVTAFERNGYPLAVWWLPADLLPSHAGKSDYEAKDIELSIWTPGQNIEDPVVIDPMTGEVYEVESWTDGTNIDVKPCLKLKNVPLKDYPMFATDRKAIELA